MCALGFSQRLFGAGSLQHYQGGNCAISTQMKKKKKLPFGGFVVKRSNYRWFHSHRRLYGEGIMVAGWYKLPYPCLVMASGSSRLNFLLEQSHGIKN